MCLLPLLWILSLGIEIVAGEGKYKMNGHNGEDFPETPVIDEGNEFTINSIALSEAISETVLLLVLMKCDL